MCKHIYTYIYVYKNNISVEKERDCNYIICVQLYAHSHICADILNVQICVRVQKNKGI